MRGLGQLPMKGKARDNLLPGLRLFPFERVAVIAYRISSDEVEVLNIFYGGRDWEAIIADGSTEY